MNQKNNDELLSAYLDDELSPAERAAVEQQLETSAEMRRELDELKQLSVLLTSIPPSTAPSTLAASVFDHVRQKTVQPAAKTTPNPPTARKNWTASIAGLLASAAVLLLMTQLLPDAADNAQVVDTVLPNDDRFEVTDKKRDKNNSDANRSLVMDDAFEGEGLAVEALASGIEQQLDLPADTQIIEVTCADIPQAVAEMQSLLSSSDIPSRHQPKTYAESTVPGGANASQAHALTAVFVQTSAAQTNTVLTTLRKNKQFTSLEPINALNLKLGSDAVLRGATESAADALPEKAKSATNFAKRPAPKPTKAKLGRGRLSVRKSRTKNSARKDLISSAPLKKSAGKEKGQPEKRLPTKQGESGSSSYQLLLRLSPTASAKRRSQATSPDAQRTKADAAANEKSPRTRRILFVFRQQSPAEPAASKAAKKK
jgi:hypothetical protein